MKKMKKLLAVLLAITTMLAMAIPAFAAQTESVSGTAKATDAADVVINGLSAGDKVNFYQIVDATYDASKGFTGYEILPTMHSSAKLFNDSDQVIYPNAEQLVALAGAVSQSDTGIVPLAGNPKTATSTSLTQNLTVGMWMVLVTPASDHVKTVYNPMVVSVCYTGDNGKVITGGTLNAAGTYNITGSNSYVKRSDATIEKTIVGNTNNDVATDKGDDLAIGDMIDFKVESTIPAYSEEYIAPVFNIYDKLDAGLTLNEKLAEGEQVAAKNIKVTVGGTDITSDETKVQINTNPSTGETFKIEFNKTYIESLRNASAAERAVVVTYSAKLNGNAKTNYEANENKATIEYTNKPGSGQTPHKEDSKTYQYTFELDGKINGDSTTANYWGHELIKVDENGEPAEGHEPTWIEDGHDQNTVTNPLADAVFKLTNNATGKEYTAVTDAKGFFSAGTDSKGVHHEGFKGLDAGAYTLVETRAPQGYSLNDNAVQVVITAEYYEADTETALKGQLKSYKVEVGNEKTSQYTATYDSDGEVAAVRLPNGPVETYYVKNTKLNELPSTGGVGTTLFTVAGIVVMLGAVALFFASRRKNA